METFSVAETYQNGVWAPIIGEYGVCLLIATYVNDDTGEFYDEPQKLYSSLLLVAPLLRLSENLSVTFCEDSSDGASKKSPNNALVVFLGSQHNFYVMMVLSANLMFWLDWVKSFIRNEGSKCS